MEPYTPSEMKKRASELESDLKKYYNKYQKIEQQARKKYLDNEPNQEFDDIHYNVLNEILTKHGL